MHCSNATDVIDRRWLGIDFSGDFRKWGAGVSRSNVWIADVWEIDTGYRLQDLRTVQQLNGQQPPFDRLVALLKTGDYLATAVDAPFSVPADFLADQQYLDFLASFGELSIGQLRPFPSGKALITGFSGRGPITPPKPLRATEQLWWDRHVNVRSTLWGGPRSGAPMTAAALTLLGRAERPIWPWTFGVGMLVEAFPAGQLHHWGMDYQGYNGLEISSREARRRSVSRLAQLIDVTSFEGILESSADALDAVLCAFAAIAVTEKRVADAPGPSAVSEGWIAVHE